MLIPLTTWTNSYIPGNPEDTRAASNQFFDDRSADSSTGASDNKR
jgi:hypothetical protein